MTAPRPWGMPRAGPDLRAWLPKESQRAGLAAPHRPGILSTMGSAAYLGLAAAGWVPASPLPHLSKACP